MVTIQEVKKKKYRCRDVCSTWNSEDCDCEIYGSQHPSPVKCSLFLQGKIDEALVNRDRLGFRCPFCSKEVDDVVIWSLDTQVECPYCQKSTLGINYVYDRRET